MDLLKIQKIHEKFCQDRGWEKFHHPKNLIMALTGEVGELNEIFQWLSEDECFELFKNEEKSMAAAEELADIMIYLSRICYLFNIDIEKACIDKFKKNEVKYPIDLAKGNSLKYTELQREE